MQLVECVPNFSEGRDRQTIDAIAKAITSVPDVHLLDVDANISANRTVMTFVGGPKPASLAAFRAIEKAQALINMEKHQGEHPRIGATDVCPFVPLSGCTMEECVGLSVELAERIGKELQIPVYLYAQSARSQERIRLAFIRQGQYERLAQRMKDGFLPDYGPESFNPVSGATAVGARNLLIAFNVNLSADSKAIAQDIALLIRQARKENGGKEPLGLPSQNPDAKGLDTEVDWTGCTSIGWYINEFRRAQVSLNLMDYEKTPLHRAFLAISQWAISHGSNVTGSEIVGLVPLKAMLDAGLFYLERLKAADNCDEAKLIESALEFLNLSDLKPFDPKRKILDYRLKELCLPFSICREERQ